MRNARLDEAQAGIMISRRNINNLRYADDICRYGSKQRAETKMMASSAITSRQIDGETMEIVTNFTFLGSKIMADGSCSHEIKRCLLLGRKAMTNLDSILKSRDITLLTKVHIVKLWFFQ